MTNPVKEALRRQADKFERAIKKNETRLLRGEIALGIFVAGALAASIGLIMLIPHPNPSPSSATVDPQGAVAAFSPPLVSAIPAGPAGDAVRRGMAIFDDPGKNAANYVGNA
ncbi:MAG: hypothetical protein ABIR51_00545, partial [Sphingomicrobium sp.]